ncbi:MAG: alkaline phosphatase family protein [Candidatus Cybelea sp.]
MRHVVILVQEGRTLGNLFTGWPSAYAPSIGNGPLGPIKLHTVTYAEDRSMCELDACMLTAYGEPGRMNGFERNAFCKLACHKTPRHPKYDVGVFPYAYLSHLEIAPYRALAHQYVLADNMYPTEWGGDFTAHQGLIAGSTFVDADHYIDDVPDAQPWGCDAPRETKVRLEHVGGYNGGATFPCFKQYPTMAELLDTAHLSWRYYVASQNGADPAGRLWNAFDAIKKVRYGPDWANDIVSPPGKILTAAAKGDLPAVSWVIPELKWSDHPASTSDMGPSWVAAVVNAIGEGPEWDSTAIVVVWSEWGGWFDARPPYFPRYLKGSGLGFRVPMLIVSPYSKSNHTSHTRYAFGSILRFVEETFSLPGLSSLRYGYVFSDTKANSIADSFDFNRKPRIFRPIPAKYPPSDFLH